MPGTRADCRAAEKEAICEGTCKEKETSSCDGRGLNPPGGRGRGSATSQGESGEQGGIEKTVTANGETESKNEALFVNYSFRHMSIGTSSSFTYSYDKITLLSSVHMEKDFTRMSIFF